MKASLSPHVILTTNYLANGIEYPAGKPVPREVVRPDHLKELEVRPGTQREWSAGGSGQFVPGVSYQFGPDGLPVRTPETAAAEKRAFQAQREIAEETWRTSGLRYADPETGEIIEPEEQP